MDGNSLDFLDRLVPAAPGPESDSAPSMKRAGSGRSLPPPPPSVLAASQQLSGSYAERDRKSGGLDIDVDVDSSSPEHPIPDGLAELEARTKSASPIPMPEGRGRSAPPPPRPPSARHAPPPPPSMRPLPPSGRSSSASLPPVPPVLRASAGPPPPPRPPLPAEFAEEFAEPEEITATPEEVETSAEADEAETVPREVESSPSFEAFASRTSFSADHDRAHAFTADAAHGAHDGDAAAALDAPPDADALPTGVAHDVPPPPPVAAGSSIGDGRVRVPSQVWNVESLPPAAPGYGNSAAAFGVGAASLPVPPPPPSVAPVMEASPRMAAAPGVLGMPTFSPGMSAPPPPPLGAAGSLPPPPPLPPPPSMPPLASAPPVVNAPEHAPSSASEWDEAPTTVYARDSLRPSAPSLRAPAQQVPVQQVPAQRVALPAMPTVPSARAPQAPDLLKDLVQRQGKWLLAGAAALVAVVGIAIAASGPDEGELVVNVAGPDGIAVDGVKVFLDDKLVCENSPCQLKEVEAVGHVLRVEAEGYQEAAPMALIVKADETKIHNVELLRDKSASGLKVSSDSGNLVLFVDGKEVGPLPLDLSDLSPGEHQLRFVGGESFEPLVQTVNLSEGETLTLEPVKLKVRTGIAKFTAGENVDGAKVLLNGKRIALPHSAELSGKKTHKLVATKDGFSPFEQEFEFEPGRAERKIEVALSPLETEELGEIEEIEGEADSEDEASPAPATLNASTTAKKSAKSTASKAKSKGSSAKSGSNGKLTLLSVPPVMVILDGRPIGQTPKRAMSVSPGNHSIVFVHPSKGRKRASAKVTAGGSKTVAVRF